MAIEPQPPTRNPTWLRDELIVALELYMRNPTSPPGKTSREVVELSKLLNDLNRALGRGGGADFRNPSGVYMKAMNFRRFDPAFSSTGRVGLAHGGKGEEMIWNEFAGDLQALRTTAAAIRDAVPIAAQAPAPMTDDQVTDAEEGRVLTVLHLRRERSRKLIEARKAKAIKEAGELRCECCDMSFEERYGERGHGFIEVHHTRPVHTLVEGDKTNLSDLALVCSNCHRIIHRRRPWLTIGEVRALVARD